MKPISTYVEQAATANAAIRVCTNRTIGLRSLCEMDQAPLTGCPSVFGVIVPKGTVKWFNSQKGYGFIQPQGGGKDVFVHISAVERAGLSGLNEGQVVDYEEVSDRGKTSAGNLRVQR